MDSSPASGGSGSASANSRASAPNIIYAVSLLVASLAILGLSRRTYRAKTSIGLGLCLACAGWAVTVSRLGTSTIPDLAIWGITAGSFAIGAVLGALWLWIVGAAGMAVASGFAFGLSILLMCADGGISSAGGRWGLLGAFGVISLLALAFVPARWRHWLELGQSTYVASWLLCISIDLFIYGASGASLGLRHVLDTNSHHWPYLAYDSPKIATRLLMALTWLLTPGLAFVQYKIWPKPESPPVSPTTTIIQEENGSPPVHKEGEGDVEKAAQTQQDPQDSMWFKSLPDGTARSSSSTLLPPVDILERGRQGSSDSTATTSSSGSSSLSPPRAPGLGRNRQSSSSSSLPLVSSPLAQGASPRNSNFRASSTVPLPGVAQLMSVPSGSPEAEALERPLPPNSRNNSQRNSKVLEYSMPASALIAHTEEAPAMGVPTPKENTLAAPQMEERPSSATSETSSGRVSGLSEYAEATASSPSETPATVHGPQLEAPADVGKICLYAAEAATGEVYLRNLDRVGDDLHGVIAAPADATDVKARYSLDAWTSFADVAARQADGTWHFSVPKPAQGAEIQLAVAAKLEDQETWDSNQGQNYTFVMQ